MKGTDQILVEVLQSLPGVECLLVPVVVTFNGNWPDPVEYYSTVYLLDDYVVLCALGRADDSQKSPAYLRLSNQPVSFYSHNKSNPCCWKKEHNNAVEFTGNESRPGDESSLYVQFAVIVLEKE